MKAPLLRRHAATLGFAALMLVLAAVVAAATAYHLVHLRSVELQRLGDAAAHHARVFESHLSHSLNVVDLTLGNLADGDVPGSDPAARSAHLRLALRHAPYLRSLSILDPDGRVAAFCSFSLFSLSANIESCVAIIPVYFTISVNTFLRVVIS